MNEVGSMDGRLLLKRRDAARLLQLSERKLAALTAACVVPFVRIGASVRYPVDALKAWIAGKLQPEGK